ncbi:MAG: hypothetical protein JXR94_15450 [Candidatus Hydrogenedentes bacterium]|nr:hypothetical protein [Candidatus Hydrogenedentota bacterium]
MAGSLTVYVTAQAFEGELAGAEGLTRAAGLLRGAGVNRVVLEGYRGGCSVPEAVLRAARDFFEAEGFATLGGLMPVYGEGVGQRAEGVETRLPCFCYSVEATLEALEIEVRKLARLFGQVVVDDAFLTSCRCARCDELRHGRDWGAFRRDLLCGVAGRLADAAHHENPAARFTVKFPQYYDRYARFGYDAARFPAIFDAVWQGTETRDPATLAYGYVEPYQGYFNLQWMRACAGDRLETGWFDSLDCTDQHFYDQAVTTHLAAPGDVTVFCYNDELLASRKMARLAKARPELDALWEAASGPVGMHVVKPPNCDGGGDLHLFDSLGMLGVPLVPATKLEPTMRSALVPAHAAGVQAVREAVPKALMAGRHVIATVDALRGMADDLDLLEFFGYRPSGVAPGRAQIAAFAARGRRYEVSHPVYVAGDLAPVDASVLVWAEFAACEHGVVRVPFVTAKSFASGGRAVVWNFGSFDAGAYDIREQLNVPVPCDLLHLPKPILDLVRRTATSALGFAIEAPARVAAFVFAEHVVFVNYAASPAEVNIRGLPWRADTLRSDSPRTRCSDGTLFLASHSHALIQRA